MDKKIVPSDGADGTQEEDVPSTKVMTKYNEEGPATVSTSEWYREGKLAPLVDGPTDGIPGKY